MVPYALVGGAHSRTQQNAVQERLASDCEQSRSDPFHRAVATRRERLLSFVALRGVGVKRLCAAKKDRDGEADHISRKPIRRNTAAQVMSLVFSMPTKH